MPPVSTTPVAAVAKFAVDVVGTSEKFAIGVVDTGGGFPPVSLTPVVHFDLRKSQRTFLGKLNHEKNLKQKI